MTQGEVEKNLKREGLFRISGDNKGLVCPFKPITCQEGACKECGIYLDWQKRGEIMLVCAWCGREIDRKPGLGQSGVSHGCCDECQRKYFPQTVRGKNEREY